MAATLARIPWATTLWLAPRTLDRFEDASRRRGHNIPLNGQDAAWRSEERQEYLWDINGHDPAKANSPFVGQRGHMKGGSVDVPTDKATRDAMKAAGFKPDANELWHWNDPDIAFMPIIRRLPGFASGGATPLPGSSTPKDDDMPVYEIVQKNGDTTFWWCVDRLTRYAIPSGVALNDYRGLLARVGQDAETVKTDSLESFGVSVSRVPFELVRLRDTSPVWISFNRTIRYYVANPTLLADYQAYLRNNGFPSGVSEVDRLEAFGAVV